MSETKKLSIFELEEGRVYRSNGSLYKRVNNRLLIQNEDSEWEDSLRTDREINTMRYKLEPLSKPVTAEQVREAIRKVVNYSVTIAEENKILAILGLE